MKYDSALKIILLLYMKIPLVYVFLRSWTPARTII